MWDLQSQRQRRRVASPKAVIAEMRALRNPEGVAGMKRFGIFATNALGLSTPQLRQIARTVGRDQQLAEELWQSGIHDARILASLVADPAAISRATMDRWAADFNSWDVCDACSYQLFDCTPWAESKIRKWAKDRREFVRRAAFAIMAGKSVHDKKAPDEVFLAYLPLLEQYAFDDRNFVRKAVNWALRAIGKRNAALCAAAIASAERIRAQNTAPARWIAADALRELRARQNK